MNTLILVLQVLGLARILIKKRVYLTTNRASRNFFCAIYKSVSVGETLGTVSMTVTVIATRIFPHGTRKLFYKMSRIWVNRRKIEFNYPYYREEGNV